MRALPRRASALLRIVAINDCYERAALPRLKTLLARRKAELPPSSSALISTLSGDFVSPSILSGMDAGRSQVAVLNACPITHCCFGNHEADLQLAELAQRCAQWGGTWLNSNLPGMAEQAAGLDEKLPPYDVIQIPTDGRRVVRVGLIGLLTSEPGVFRHDRFRGLRIEDSMEAAQRTVQSLRSQHNVDAVVALTHQSVAADKVLAASGLVDLVLGGHEHEVILLRNEGHAPIVKAGQDAEVAALVDMSFEVEDEEATGGDGSARAEVASVQISFEEVAQYPPEPELQAEVDSHHAVLTALEEEIVCSSSDLLLSGPATALDPASLHLPLPPLSSVGTRFRQTSVGALLASACRDVLQVDAALINGGSIKGSAEYENGQISYLQLQRELPFPTKMCVVPMPGRVLQEALTYSRAGEETDERRGYLQVDAGVEVDEANDHQILRVQGAAFDPKATYYVGIPRNLFKGIFDIRPLVQYAQANPQVVGKEDGREDGFGFVPALTLVMQAQARSIWRRLGEFDEIDLNHDGELDRHEIAVSLEAKLGAAPSEMLMDNVLRALDADSSGRIDKREYARLLRDELPAPLKKPPWTPSTRWDLF